MTAGPPEGLRSRAPERPARNDAFEFPRGREAAAAIHRDRRLKVATALLAASLVLGVYWTYEFYLVSGAPGEPVGDLNGLVVDMNDAPVGGATVWVSGTDNAATTNATGVFTLHNISSGRTTLVVEREGYVTTSFTVFAAPTVPGTPSAQPEFLRIDAGTGTSAQDLAAQRDLWMTACLSTFLIGNVMNGLGLVAVWGRRRYRHAMLGGVGAILSFGAILGMFFGVVSMFLLMGAREEFEDRASLFATEHDMPFPRGPAADDDAVPEESGPPDEGEGSKEKGPAAEEEPEEPEEPEGRA